MLAALALLFQSAPVGEALKCGAPRTGQLALELRDGQNQARARIQIDPSAVGACTLQVRSLDFEPTLVLRRSDGGAILGEGRRAIWCDAWLSGEIPVGVALEVEVGSKEGRGGEFTLVLCEGHPRPPVGAELTRARRAARETALRRAEERGDELRALQCWREIGGAAQSQGDCAGARQALERTLQLATQLSVPEAQREARLLLALCSGGAAQCLAPLQALEPEFEAAAAAAPNKQARDTCAKHLALLHDGLGEAKFHLLGMPAAKDDFRKAAEALEGVGGKQQLQTAWSKLSAALEMSGAPAEADRALERVDLLAPDSAPAQLRAVARFSRARVEGLRGASRAARAHALEALALDPAPDLRVDILGTLANASLDLALYEDAAEELAAFGALVEALRDSAGEVLLRRSRAVLARRLRDLPRARAELEAALESCERHGETEGWIQSSLDLALVFEAQGQRAAAGERLDLAIERAQSSGQLNLAGRAWLDRGYLHEQDRQLEKAQEAYERAAQAAAASDDARLAALAEGGIGMLAHLRGDGRGAREHAGRAARRLEELAFTEEALDAHDVLARQAFADLDAPALRAEIERSSELLARFEGQKLEALLRTSHRSRFAEWSACEQSLVELELCLGEPSGAPAVLQRGFEAASRWKGKTLLAGLAHELAPDASAHGLDAARRAAWLPPRAAIVEYAASLERLGVYLVRPGSVEFVDLGERAPLAAAAQRFAERMADDGADGDVLLSEAALLWQKLLRPVIGRLPPSVHTLVIVPSPELATLPFEALVREIRPRGEEPLCLIDDYLVCYAPSSALLPLLAERPARAAPERALVVADALYPRDPRTPPPELASRGEDAELSRLGRLKFSRDEALGLVELLLESQSGEHVARAEEVGALKMGGDAPLSGGCFDLFLGAQATAAVLERDLRDYSDLHLALHARVDPADPRRSSLVFSPVGGRSGLFTLEQAWNSELDADLVVLSACGSARGPVLAGEGVQSLAYAFLHAGARALVATLWSVDDRDAAEILQDLERGRHSSLAQHPAWALREARLAYRARTGKRGESAEEPKRRWKPWTWAPYVFIGAPPR